METVKFNKCGRDITFTKESLSYYSNRKNYDWFVANYTTWEPETFAVMDKYLRSDKVYLDIGGWIGTTCLYASKASKMVVVCEADPVAANGLCANIGVGGYNNMFVVGNPVYSKTGDTVLFGPNRYIPGDWNDSKSQILPASEVNSEHVKLETISLHDLVDFCKRTNSDRKGEISLIKVDIEGGEENIMDDLAVYRGKIPIYLSFHLAWWHNQDIGRFIWLTEEERQCVIKHPFCSLLLL